MLGVSGLLGSSSDGAAADEAREPAGGVGGEGEVGAGGGAGPSGTGGGLSEEEKGRVEEADRSAAGNRWPRQETLALLKIRSDMDVVFRDSSLKGPLWEEVSRKLAELGYHRSAKKCKEKFENVYKYHKRTREGRASKSDGKTYRFFDQLEALDSHPSLLSLPQPKPHLPAAAAVPATTATMPLPLPMATVTATATTTTTMGGVGMAQGVTVPSTTTPIIVSGNSGATATATSNTTIPPNPPPPATVMNPYQTAAVAAGLPSFQHNFSANFMSNSTSSATSSDDEPERRRKRKRRWEDFFERLMKEVIRKQEELQRKFLETLEKRERDRMVREESWRVQEMARLNREHELLVHERSIAAAKDAAVIAFLQKVSEQNPNIPPLQMQMQMQVQETQPQPPPPPPPPPQPQPQPQLQILQQPPLPPPPPQKTDNGGDNFKFNTPPSSSRWPKAEVQELIRLRTNLDLKYQENGPKGPLWEEISAAMRKLGYNRSSKRCKEKWENINKYFKKVKESNKKRPEDSKTCPYFQQLDALYKEKNKADPPLLIKPESTMAPIMARPEQQWPLPLEEDEPGTATAAEDHESENMDQNHDDEDVEEEEEEEEEEEDDEAGGYEIVTNKQSSVDNVE